MLRFIVISLLVALGVGATACEPHQMAAWQAAMAQREQIKMHPFLTCVRHHESDRGPWPHVNGYGAQNPVSTASGAYQFLDTTWRVVSARAGHPGYAKAKYAPDWVQDDVAYDTAIRRGERYHWNGTGC